VLNARRNCPKEKELLIDGGLQEHSRVCQPAA